MSDYTMAIIEKYGIALIMFVVGLIVIKILVYIEEKALKKSRLDDALHMFILKATKITMWIILVLMVLPKIGISIASLVTVLATGGAAIALALKDSLGNIASGIIILINKPFVRNDTIEINGVIGVVDDIDLLATHLHTYDNKMVNIPNGMITSSILQNYTRNGVIKVTMQFGIGYSSSITAAREAIESVAKGIPEILEEPKTLTGVAKHGDNAIILEAHVWTLPENVLTVKYALAEGVKTAFDDAEIEIPYPQIDVHIAQ